MLLLYGVPLKVNKKNWPGLQFTRTDYLSLVLTPLRIRWTIPLSSKIVTSSDDYHSLGLASSATIAILQYFVVLRNYCRSFNKHVIKRDRLRKFLATTVITLGRFHIWPGI
jgi:hypothetical protein